MNKTVSIILTALSFLSACAFVFVGILLIIQMVKARGELFGPSTNTIPADATPTYGEFHVTNSEDAGKIRLGEPATNAWTRKLFEVSSNNAVVYMPAGFTVMKLTDEQWQMITNEVDGTNLVRYNGRIVFHGKNR